MDLVYSCILSKKKSAPPNEVFYGRDWKGWTLDDFMYFIDRYLNWFRNERIKTSLNNKSPKEYRTELGLAL